MRMLKNWVARAARAGACARCCAATIEFARAPVYACRFFEDAEA